MSRLLAFLRRCVAPPACPACRARTESTQLDHYGTCRGCHIADGPSPAGAESSW